LLLPRAGDASTLIVSFFAVRAVFAVVQENFFIWHDGLATLGWPDLSQSPIK
jgi:hypothetical protein